MTLQPQDWMKDFADIVTALVIHHPDKQEAARLIKALGQLCDIYFKISDETLKRMVEQR